MTEQANYTCEGCGLTSDADSLPEGWTQTLDGCDLCPEHGLTDDEIRAEQAAANARGECSMCAGKKPLQQTTGNGMVRDRCRDEYSHIASFTLVGAPNAPQRSL